MRNYGEEMSDEQTKFPRIRTDEEKQGIREPERMTSNKLPDEANGESQFQNLES